MKKINYYSKEQCISLINHNYSRETPFIFLTDFDTDKNIFFTLDTLPDIIKFETDRIKYSKSVTNLHIDKSYKIFTSIIPPKLSDYKKSFDNVKNNIALGNTYLCNLTFSSEITLNTDLDFIYSIAKAKYKFLKKDDFLFFSPETFITISKSGNIKTYPMKGTGIHTSNDLSKSYKEKAEHATIVDLLRNDLSMVANNVKVENYRYLETIYTNESTLFQTSTCISGNLPHNFKTHLGEILFSMLPAGSITGAPKKKTIEIIKQTETHVRDFYTGIMGVFDGEIFDSCVIIRYIEKKNNKYFYKSGGGITFLSDLHNEFNELCAKIYVPIG
ncbi:MAG: aminodeoxychorismate synthase component I [Endomicrobiia bacterium]